jgi:predicted 2-oxoglutarate/Fe(II)-dependent dioxygenase YbiX
LISHEDCKLLREYSNKYGLAYHRPDELLVTPRRVRVPAQRDHFLRVVDDVAQAILHAASAASFPLEVNRLVIDEAVLIRTGPDGQPKHADSRRLDGSNNHTPHRLLSASVGCSAKGAYEGGELNFYSSQSGTESYQLTVGSGVIFTSGTVHSVSPVRSGERHQLLYWFVDIENDVRSKNRREIAFIKQWLEAQGLSNLFRFYKEFLSHKLLSSNHQLSDPGVLARIGLSTIESRRLSATLKLRNEL